MTQLEADKERSDNRYDAARSIGKRLAKLTAEDRLIVLKHVLLEHGLDVVPLAHNGTEKAKPS